MTLNPSEPTSFNEDTELIEQLQRLKRSRFFQNIPIESIESLAPISKIAHYNPQELILQQQTENHKLCILLSGTVDVLADGNFILSLRRIGDIFGEVSVINQTPCLASVMAKTPVQLLEIQAGAIIQQDLSQLSLETMLYRAFSHILGDKLWVTTEKAKMFETANEALEDARIEAERANQFKTEFMRNVTHELRTPLTTVLGNIQLITDPNMLNDKDEIAEIAKDIQQASSHLLTLVNDLLDTAKIESGSLDLHYETLRTQDFINIALKPMRVLFEEKNIDLLIEAEDLEIRADLVRLQQVLLNLVNNALKFTEKGFVKVSVSAEEHFARFDIEDTGVGIHETEFIRIFEPFRQAKSSQEA